MTAAEFVPVAGASRGVPVDWSPADGNAPGARAVATVHPSTVLRAPDRAAAYAGLLADLRVCARLGAN